MSALAPKKTNAERKQARNSCYRKIHAIWSHLRTDLKRNSEEYRDGLLTFAEAELTIPQIGSLTELTLMQLSRLITALEAEQRQPPLIAEGNVVQFPQKPRKQTPAATTGQPVAHLASLEQRFAINRLLGYLGWSDYGKEKFLESKFRTSRVEMLLQKQAHSCIRILLNCAGSKYWKAQGKEKVSKPMIAAVIPKIKAEIGIG